MIEAKNVVKSFDGFRALDGLTMTVPHGSIYGLVGPNGAGKSTLLRHVTGVYRQDSGSVLIEGNPVYENPAAKSRIASIPDELYYFLSASTRDMMRFYRGFYPRFDVKRYEALKDVFTTIHGKAAHPAALQGHAEAVRLLAGPVLPAGHPGAGRAGGRPGPGDAPAGVVPADGRRGRPRHHGAGLLPQPAGAGGRVRPCGHSLPGEGAH